jgi:hypothetical protein
MKSIFDKTTRDTLIHRINQVDANSKAQWGKMNAYQMLKHCRLWEAWASGNQHNKRAFIGYLFGKIALKSILKDDRPLTHHTPTNPEFVIKETTGDIEAEKQQWIALLEAHEHIDQPYFVHTFFGKVTREQVGYLAYKHADHHLRQFNA